MSRWTFQINAAAIIALVLCLVLGAALVHSRIDAARAAREAETARRQIAGQLDEAERRFMAADLGRGKAESRVVELAALQKESAGEIASLRKALGQKDIEVRRRSDAAFKLQQEVTGLLAQVETSRQPGGAVAYSYRLPWFRFATPDVFRSGGETLAFDVRARLRVVGITKPGGVLQTETVDLTLTDPAGEPLPIQPVLESYDFRYAVQPPARGPWYRKIHLDVFGGIGAAYPLDWRESRIAAGIEASFWGVTLSATGEATPQPELRALLGLGYRWRAF